MKINKKRTGYTQHHFFLKSKHNSQRTLSQKPESKSGAGYIAITASIIITILVLAIVITTSSMGYFGRFNILGSLTKEKGDALSEACADTALLELALDIDYAGATTTNVASSTCEIFAIETTGDEKTIKTQGIRDNTITNTKIILDTTDFTIVSWDEVESF